MSGDETLESYAATGCGSTTVTMTLEEGGGVSIRVHARWMGSPPFDVTLRARHLTRTEHHGVVALESAEQTGGAALELPPSDGEILLEYVRIPVQEDLIPGNAAMAAAGTWNDHFSAVLWVHRDADWDDGTQMSPEDYDVPIERFAPVAKALGRLERVWKLG